MGGATLTFASAAKPNLPVRSHSSPDLVSLSSHYPLIEADSSVGLLSLPNFNLAPLDDSIFQNLKDPSITTISSLPSRPRATQEPTAAEVVARRRTDVNRPHSWIPSRTDGDFGGGLGPDFGPVMPPSHHNDTLPYSAPAATKPGNPESRRRHRPRSASGSYINLSSLSWLRRPSSEDERAAEPTCADEDSALPPKRIWGREKSDSVSTTTRALNLASIYLTRIKQRPQTVFGRSGLGASPSKWSSETARAFKDGAGSAYASSTDVSAVDELVSTPVAHSEPGSEITAASTVRDPLWSPFRDLEGAYHNFVTKQSTALRMTVVKTTLVPFLHRYACDPSNNDADVLSPDDVERRATILGKWWAVMLQLLDGNSGRISWNESIPAILLPEPTLDVLAGLDRPIVIGAITLLMTRPEWRLSTPHFRPLKERCPSEKVRARSDSGALSLNDSFVAKATERNVRDIFMSNLVTQVTIVIYKLSYWNTPEPIVTFAGKTLAHAFFFVPGVAQIVVRLWGLDSKPSLITRVVDEFELPRKSLGESDDIVALFPPNLGSLGYSSVKSLREKLRRPPKIPLQLAHVPWHGPWVSRWRGGDTNLFFVFCKYFYIISEEFMPAGLPLVEKARAPAFVLIHAQLLSNLDDTINRQAAFEALTRPPLPNSSHGADAALTPMGPFLPHANMFRGMDENCIIILLRDFLSAANGLLEARHAFAEAFMRLLKTATKQTGQYDHDAQHLLCDFLQEALHIYHAASVQPGDGASLSSSTSLLCYVDRPFWFDVCKMMLSNNNTMSEIRTLSFLFVSWDIIAADPVDKESLCIDWLLDEEVFAKFFCNWCPMVRAYYLRLLCWRICRDSGSTNELDARIWIIVSERLRTTYAHYLWLKKKAEQSTSALPSTTPSLPQPGKRFMIVRTEIMGSPHQGLLASSPKGNPIAQIDTRLPDGYCPPEFGIENSDSESEGSESGRTAPSSKRRSIFAKLRGLNTSAGESRPGNYSDETSKTHRETAGSRQQSDGPPLPPKDDGPIREPASPGSESTGSAPTFDAERYVFRFTLHAIPWHNGAPIHLKEQVINRPRLPAPAQSRVNAKLASAGYRDENPPPLSAGRPPPTRAISGWMQGGLVSEARNALPVSPSVSAPDENTDECLSHYSARSGMASLGGGDVSPSDFNLIGQLPFESSAIAAVVPETHIEPSRPKDWERLVRDVEPTGVHRTTSRYAGRALAEWNMVVSECNSFVDRRREEGILGLRDVEVPILVVEGVRRSG